MSKNPQSRPIAVIGSGYAGLSAALALLKRKIPVVIFEKGGSAGGLAGSLEIGGSKLERFYHHFFTSDTYLTSLAEQLGLADKIVWIKPKTAVYFEGQFFELKNALDLLKFSPLPLVQRIKMGLLLLKGRNLKDWQQLDKVTAKDWIERSVGQAAYQVLWEPLLVSKFGAAAKDISAAWLWSKFKLRGSSRNAQGQEVLGYFKDGGFYQVTEALVKRITELGGKFRFNSALEKLTKVEGGWQVTTSSGKEKFDQVIVTTAPSLLAQVLENISPEYQRQLTDFDYQGNICLVIEAKEKLSDYYWISVEDLSCPFVAIIEHTNFVDRANYGGEHIFYLSRYIDPNDPLFKASDEEVEEVFFAYLKKVFPKFRRSSIIKTTISRAPFTQPIARVGHQGKVLPLVTPCPGLILATMAQIYPEDRGTNYAIRIGQEAARLIE